MYIEDIIKLVQNQTKPKEIEEITYINDLYYKIRCSIRFWKNPFTGKSGHKIRISLEHTDKVIKNITEPIFNS